MKISNSYVYMESKNLYEIKNEKEESYRFRRTENPSNSMSISNKLEVSQRCKILDDSSTLSPSEKIKVKIIEELVRILTGKRIKIKIPEISAENVEQLQLTYDQKPHQLRWAMDYQYDESYQEKEEISFNAKGFVELENGEKIDFNLEFSLNRAFSYHKSFRLRIGDDAFLDPIVINFGNESIEFSDKKYQFDLDMDGTKEEINFVRGNSGFLVYDRNDDGIINDGKELFGPTTGNGFAELSVYDDDGNGWIDEADSIFSKLKIWIKNEEDRDILFSLKDKKIGAIYLNSINSIFHIKNINNEEIARIRRVGLFLYEDGNAGTAIHVDIKV